MLPIVDLITTSVPPEDYYNQTFEGLRWPGNSREARVLCPFHVDTDTPSLSLNPETGAWFCHGCHEGGKSIVTFHAKFNDLSIKDAAHELYAKYVRPVIPESYVRQCVKQLQDCPTAMSYVAQERFLSIDTIDKYDIGWNGRRVVIPVRDEFGLCVNARLYDPLVNKAQQKPKGRRSAHIGKMVHYTDPDKQETRSYGEIPMFLPLWLLLSPERLGEPVFLCEGEWDCLVLISLGLIAVSVTGGSGSWPAQYNHLFTGRKVVMCYDNDEAGQKAMEGLLPQQIGGLVEELYRIDIPKEMGKDVSLWVKNDTSMRSDKAWLALIDGGQNLVVQNDPADLPNEEEVPEISLQQATQARWFHRKLRVKGIITGKDISPYLLPKVFHATCSGTCDECPLADAKENFRKVEVDPNDPRVLNMVNVGHQACQKICAGMSGLGGSGKCQVKIDVLSTFNVEHLMLIPTLESSNGQYVMRPSYYVGHGLTSNRAYEFKGQTVIDPENQHATHLFEQATAVQDEIETFVMTEELREELSVFQYNPDKSRTLMAHFMAFADWQSRNITKIHERPDLHITVDLVFHSVQGFMFNGERVKKGLLDVLVLGDTRCGKGYVAEGLTRYYGIGEVASGEMCSFAGLIGGLQQINKRWFVTWGVIPLNNNRLVVIDEASALSQQDISHMSRVRSEGVAEISKIVRESTRAATRLLWLSNPRSGRPLNSYDRGVEAIEELIGANEDISRFDFALTVAKNEVASEIINASFEESKDANQYPSALCRSMVLWAWSRTPDQVQFTEKAVSLVIKVSVEFGQRYSSVVPLVQSENIRIKVARVAAAIAARVFSTDDTGELLIVDRIHVEFAASFLRMAYSKSSMGYDRFSNQITERTAMPKSTEPINAIFNTFNEENREVVLRGLSELHQITADTLADYVGDTDAAKNLIGDLIKSRCLTRSDRNNTYMKNPGFRIWLRSNTRSSHDRSYDRPISNGNGQH